MDRPTVGKVTPLLDVSDLEVRSRIGNRLRRIVAGIDLTVYPGETVGIVGESGSGKSLTALSILGLLPDGVGASGKVLYNGSDVLRLSERELRKLRGRDVALLLQDPFTMLNPLMRCGDQVAEALNATTTGHARRARNDEVRRRLAEVGLNDPRIADQFPFQLSGGMRQRVGLAAALAGDPRLLVADEPTTALDVTTQREILMLLKRLQNARSMGVVLITHDLRVAFSICDRIYVLYAGTVVETAAADRIEAEPIHPYTLGLLLSEPPADRRLERLAAISGSVARFDEISDGCPFAPRCEWSTTRCLSEDSRLIELEPDRRTACSRIEDIRPNLAERRRAATAEGHVEYTPQSKGHRLIEVHEIGKIFTERGSRARAHGDFQALRAASIEVGTNESVGIVGESGSGKTTLARCIVGLEVPTSGRIIIDGVDVTDYSALTAAERDGVRKTVQFIFQDPYSSLNPARTIGATLREALLRSSAGSRAADRQVAELLKLVGLRPDYEHLKPHALSGGERQRVAIARALAVQPKVIICDEPASALDVSVQAQILNLFRALQERLGVSYLFISHNLAVVRQITERIYVMCRGEVIEAGDVNAILDRPTHPYTASLVASIPRSNRSWLEGGAPA